MIQDYKDIDGYWGVLFCYGYDERDSEDIEAILDNFGLSAHKVAEALNILRNPNTGMTVTQPRLRMSVVFISMATSRGQWVDTIMHELDHVQASMCDYYNIEKGSEEAAYLQGYLARQATPIIEEICPFCGRR
ncbi:MAG: hypothetical protein IJT30_03295 [Muribaculaceae bacterium]|nr:hypothetical protein [Muribaculaceae bacterium]